MCVYARVCVSLCVCVVCVCVCDVCVCVCVCVLLSFVFVCYETAHILKSQLLVLFKYLNRDCRIASLGVLTP